jgi:hypothetical protein
MRIIAHAVLFGRDLKTSVLTVSYPPPHVLKLPVRRDWPWDWAAMKNPTNDLTKPTFDVRQFRLDRTAVLNVDGSMQYAYWEF